MRISSSFSRVGIAIGIAVLAASGGGAQSDQASGEEIGQEIGRFTGIVVLVFMSGLFSGLTLGLLGLDTNQLSIVAEAGAPDNRKNAKIILPLRKRGNFLLCTLLLGNVAVNSLLSILLADLTDGTVGFLSSTALIVIFGEIIPQATCSRYPLYIGAKAVPLVKVIMLLLSPVAYPISLCLDWALGKEVGDFYDENEFEKLIEQHAEQRMMGAGQARIMRGALRIRQRIVGDVMTPWRKVFSLKLSSRLDYNTMSEVFRRGFSRIPVIDDENPERVTGVLLAKDLLLLVPANCTPVATVLGFFEREQNYARLDRNTKLEEALRIMQASRKHLAVVEEVDASDEDRDPVLRLAGIVTLEDIIEEILQVELVDETDVLVSNVDNAARAGKRQFRDAELRGLADVSRGHNDLDHSMVSGISAHLSTNVAPFRELPLESVRDLVEGGRVVELAGDAQPWLYERGSAAFSMTLILEGQVEVFSGEDQIRSTAGPYDDLAQRALTNPDYQADFSARPHGSKVRFLRITRDEYQDALLLRRQFGSATDEAAGAVADDAVTRTGTKQPRETSSSIPPPTPSTPATPGVTSPSGLIPRGAIGGSNPDDATLNKEGTTSGGLIHRYPYSQRKVRSQESTSPKEQEKVQESDVTVKVTEEE